MSIEVQKYRSIVRNMRMISPFLSPLNLSQPHSCLFSFNAVYLSHVQIINGTLDVGIGFPGYITALWNEIDYTDYLYYNEVGVAVCNPRKKSPFFNLLRPFRCVISHYY